MKERIGKRIWFTAIFFGLIGQIAWIVENMYFATLAQDIFSNSGNARMSYIVTTLMVIFSAITATVTTFIAGTISDKVGKRRPFISFGYIIWGLTIMLFAFLPMSVSRNSIMLVAFLLVLFDCLMTVAGSTSNDTAFNAWVIDNTTPSTRGRINSILSTLPVFAVVIVFIGLGGFYDSKAESNALFFIILGIIPIISGIIGLLVIRDSSKLTRSSESIHILYGFKRSSIQCNKLLYICLLAICLIQIAQQTFFSYLINYLSITLGLGAGFVVPMAVIIVFSALFTGITGFLADRFGRRSFYYPTVICAIAGIFSFWGLKFISGGAKTAIIYIGGIVMMYGILSLTAILTASFQDRIPAGYEGNYQGVRMCFMVMIPMIIGPIISLFIGLDAMGMNGENFVPPYTMFLAATIVAIIAIIPISIIRSHEKEANH